MHFSEGVCDFFPFQTFHKKGWQAYSVHGSFYHGVWIIHPLHKGNLGWITGKCSLIDVYWNGNIHEDHVVSSTTIIMTHRSSILGPIRVSWIEEWFTLNVLVLESLERMLAKLLCSFRTCKIYDDLNFNSLSRYKVTYHYNNGSLVCAYLYTCKTMSKEYVLNLTFSTPILAGNASQTK